VAQSETTTDVQKGKITKLRENSQLIKLQNEINGITEELLEEN
jgi:hypothetical protein